MGLEEARVGEMEPLCLYPSLVYIPAFYTLIFFSFPPSLPSSLPPSLPCSLPQSARGLFGDAAQEMDASVGLIVQKLHDLGLLDNTMVIFTR